MADAPGTRVRHHDVAPVRKRETRRVSGTAVSRFRVRISRRPGGRIRNSPPVGNRSSSSSPGALAARNAIASRGQYRIPRYTFSVVVVVVVTLAFVRDRKSRNPARPGSFRHVSNLTLRACSPTRQAARLPASTPAVRRSPTSVSLLARTVRDKIACESVASHARARVAHTTVRTRVRPERFARKSESLVFVFREYAKSRRTEKR